MSLIGKKFVLENGMIIKITNTGIMQFSDQCGNVWGTARPHEQEIIEKLLENPGEYVISRDLCNNGNVRRALRSLNPTILCNIKNKYADGYRILLRTDDANVPPVEAISVTRNIGLLCDLAGGYYCFYLDPNGHPLGAYVHIDCIKNNESTEMKAYAVLGIASDADLFKSAEVFSGESDYETNFHAFTTELFCRDADCLWAVGEVKEYPSHLISVCLKGAGEAHWNIVIDASAYMLDTRERIQDVDYYRGGMATIIAAWSQWGTTAFRFGMVRKSCFAPNKMLLNSPVIISKLKPTCHVNLDSTTVDRDFYTWLDSNRPKTQKLQ